ncbi:MAG: NADH-quinone oxidoreductase subunit C [Bacteroides sp.]|jgi:NADH-quinone oxidoreductase subunit C|nr:NADH-quinone oxidoreductase subunit C [Bacteroides sp.]
MDTQEFIDFMKFKFKHNVLRAYLRYRNRVLIDLEKDALVKVATFLFKELNFRFIIATGLDNVKDLEITYHFSNDQTGLVANVRVRIPRKKPEVESLTPLFVAADWIEREMHELLGINFLNHPNMRSLLSGDNWGEGEYPYRKPIRE